MGEELFLELEGAFFEPVVLDEGIGEALFGVGFRIVFGVDALDESLEVGGIFPRKDGEAAGESMGAAVLGDGGFAGRSDRTR